MSEETLAGQATPAPEGAVIPPPEGGETVVAPETTTGTEAPKDPPQGESKETPKETPKETVPEKYEFKAPEGMVLDEAAVAEFTPIGQKYKISQEAAQELMDLHAKRLADFTKTQTESWQKVQAGWLEEIKGDKEFGGTNLPQTMKASNAALGEFFTKEEVKQIEDLGMSNFSPLVKGLARIGKLMAEGKYVAGTGTPKETDPAKQMYPYMK